eukprot:1177488-Prorocentrum_minimum.AAC.3
MEAMPLLVELLPSDGTRVNGQSKDETGINVPATSQTDNIFAWGDNSDESSDDDWDFEIEANTIAAIEQRVKAIGAPNAWALIKESHVGDFIGGVYCPCPSCRHRTAFRNQSALMQHMKTISYRCALSSTLLWISLDLAFLDLNYRGPKLIIVLNISGFGIPDQTI